MSLERIGNLKITREGRVENVKENILSAKQKMRNGILAVLAVLMPINSFDGECVIANTKSNALSALSKIDPKPAFINLKDFKFETPVLVPQIEIDWNEELRLFKKGLRNQVINGENFKINYVPYISQKVESDDFSPNNYLCGAVSATMAKAWVENGKGEVIEDKVLRKSVYADTDLVNVKEEDKNFVSPKYKISGGAASVTMENETGNNGILIRSFLRGQGIDDLKLMPYSDELALNELKKGKILLVYLERVADTNDKTKPGIHKSFKHFIIVNGFQENGRVVKFVAQDPLGNLNINTGYKDILKSDGSNSVYNPVTNSKIKFISFTSIGR